MAIYYAADWGNASAAGTASDPVISDTDLLSAGFTSGDECRFMRGSAFADGAWTFTSLNGIRLVDYGEKSKPRPVLLDSTSEALEMVSCDHPYVRGLEARSPANLKIGIYKNLGKGGLIEDCRSDGCAGYRAYITDAESGEVPCIFRDCVADNALGDNSACGGFGFVGDGRAEFIRCRDEGYRSSVAAYYRCSFFANSGTALFSECVVNSVTTTSAVGFAPIGTNPTNMIIDRCFVHAKAGIYNLDPADATIEVYNSVFLGSESDLSNTTLVRDLEGTARFYIAHNAFILRPPGSPTNVFRAIGIDSGATPQIAIANNVFHHTDPTNQKVFYVEDDGVDYPHINAQGNRYFLGGTATDLWADGTSYDAFAAWKTSVDGDTLATESTANTLRTAITDINVDNYKWAAMTHTDAVANSTTEIPPTAPSATNLVRANWGGPNAHLLRKDINGRPRTGTLVEQGPFVDRGDP